MNRRRLLLPGWGWAGRPETGCVAGVNAVVLARTETWQQGKYVSALVSELPKRNGWTIAGELLPGTSSEADAAAAEPHRASRDTLAAMTRSPVRGGRPG